MKNKLTDLGNHLYAQLERLGDEGLSKEQLELETLRADAIVKVSNSVIHTAGLQLKAAQLVAEHGQRIEKHLPPTGAQLENGSLKLER